MRLVVPKFLGIHPYFRIERGNGLECYISSLLFGTVEYEFDSGCILLNSYIHAARNVKVLNIFGQEINARSVCPIKGAYSSDGECTVSLSHKDVTVTFKTNIKSKLDVGWRMLSVAKQAVEKKARELECCIDFCPDSIVAFATSREEKDTYWLFFDTDIRRGPLAVGRNVPIFLKVVNGELEDYSFSISECVNNDVPTTKIREARLYNSNLCVNSSEFFGDELVLKYFTSFSLKLGNVFVPVAVGDSAAKAGEFGCDNVSAVAYVKSRDMDHYRLIIEIETPHWKVLSRAKVDNKRHTQVSCFENYVHKQLKNKFAYSGDENYTKVCMRKCSASLYFHSKVSSTLYDKANGNEGVKIVIQNNFGRVEARHSYGFNADKAAGTIDVYLPSGNNCNVNTVKECRSLVRKIIKTQNRYTKLASSRPLLYILRIIDNNIPFIIKDHNKNIVKISWIDLVGLERKVQVPKRIKHVTLEEFRDYLNSLRVIMKLAE